MASIGEKGSTEPDITHGKRSAACFPFRGMVKFAEGLSDDELLAYCVAFGVVIGVMLGFLIGLIARNSLIGPMGAAIGIFIGLAAWIVLSDQTGF